MNGFLGYFLANEGIGLGCPRRAIGRATRGRVVLDAVVEATIVSTYFSSFLGQGSAFKPLREMTLAWVARVVALD